MEDPQLPQRTQEHPGGPRCPQRPRAPLLLKKENGLFATEGQPPEIRLGSRPTNRELDHLVYVSRLGLRRPSTISGSALIGDFELQPWLVPRERENPLIALGAYQGSSGTEASLFTWVIPIQESGNAQTGKLPLGDEAHTRREGGQPEIVVQWYTDWR